MSYSIKRKKADSGEIQATVVFKKSGGQSLKYLVLTAVFLLFDGLFFSLIESAILDDELSHSFQLVLPAALVLALFGTLFSSIMAILNGIPFSFQEFPLRVSGVSRKDLKRLKKNRNFILALKRFDHYLCMGLRTFSEEEFVSTRNELKSIGEKVLRDLIEDRKSQYSSHQKKRDLLLKRRILNSFSESH